MQSGKSSGPQIEAQHMVASVKAKVLGEPTQAVHLGPYRLVRRLGRGSTGVVYEARHRSSGERVALKTLHRGPHSDPALLMAEFRAACGLHHRNLVGLYELDATAAQPYLVMELIDGRDLASAARGWANADRWDRVEDLFGQVAEGLAYLHGRGLVHCDIKPANVLVDASGRAVILDFGLAWGRNLVRTTWGGTPGYMAPERATAPQVSANPELDVYALGRMAAMVLEGVAAEPTGPMRWLVDRATADSISDRPSATEIAGAMGRRTEVRTRGTLVGRRREQQELERLAGLGSVPRVAWVIGGSGAGKTTLAEAFVHGWGSSKEGGAPSGSPSDEKRLVLRARCHARESVPFHAMRQLAEGLRTHFETMAPPLRELFIGDNPQWLTHAFGEPRVASDRGIELKNSLRRLAATYAVVVLVDDLQWIDEDSARVFQDMLRPPGVPELMFIGCSRPTGNVSNPHLRACFEAAEQSTTIELGPMDSADAEALVRATAPALADSLVSEFVAEAAGDPYVLQQLVEGRISRHSQGDTESLSAGSERLLAVVAVAGEPVDRRVALHAASVTDGLATVHRLEAQRLITHLGESGEIEVYHGRVRDSVLERMALDQRRSLHGDLARALLRLQPGHRDAIATHLDDAGHTNEAKEYARIAATAAESVGAYGRAAELLEIVVRGAATRQERRAATLERARLLTQARRPDDAAELYLLAATDLEGRARAVARQAAAHQLLSSAQISRGIRLLSDVLPEFGLSLPSSRADCLARVAYYRARVWARGLAHEETGESALSEEARTKLDACLSAGQGLINIDILKGAALQSQFTLLALDAGEPKRVAWALALEAATVAAIGKRADRRSRALIVDAARAASSADDPHVQGIVELYAGVAHLVLGRWQLALSTGKRAHRRLLEVGASAWELQTAADTWLNALRLLGGQRELALACDQLLERGLSLRDRYCSVSMRAWTHMVALVRDEPALAHAEVDAVEREWPYDGFSVQNITTILGRARVLCYEGRFSEAHAMLNRQWPRLRGSGLLGIPMVRMDALAWRVRAAIGTYADTKKRSLHRHTVANLGYLQRVRYPGASELAHSLRASLMILDDDRSGAERELRGAAHGFERVEMATELACARRCLADLVAPREANRLRRLADTHFKTEDLAAPERFRRMTLPGFPEGPPS